MLKRLLNEAFAGSYSDVLFIADTLGRARSQLVKPTAPQRLTTLHEMLAPRAVNTIAIDVDLFEAVVHAGRAYIEARFPGFRLLAPDRFIIGDVEADDDDWGGFYSKYAQGFNPYSAIGYATVLNRNICHSESIRTIELARSYLHDSIHADTFKLWRVARIGDQKQVYRYQYGFNFRTYSGVSYSAKALTFNGPDRINLNLLMDGIDTLIVSRAIYPFVIKLNSDNTLLPLEHVLIDDLLGRASLTPATFRGSSFYTEVIRPTEAFIERWGGEVLLQLLFRSMLMGSLTEVAPYFNNSMGTSGAWKALFASDAWRSAA